MIGGTGFLGRHLVEHAPGAVAATHHRSAAARTSASAWHRCDLADGGAAIGDADRRSAGRGGDQRRLRARAATNLDAVTALAPGADGDGASAESAPGSSICRPTSSSTARPIGPTARPTRPRPSTTTGGRRPTPRRRRGRADPERASIVRTSLLWGDARRSGSAGRADDRSRSHLLRRRVPQPVPGRRRSPRACLELTRRPEIVGPAPRGRRRHRRPPRRSPRRRAARRRRPATSLRGAPSPAGDAAAATVRSTAPGLERSCAPSSPESERHSAR